MNQPICLRMIVGTLCSIVLSHCTNVNMKTEHLMRQRVRDAPTGEILPALNWQKWAPSRKDQVVTVVGTIKWINSRPTRTFTIENYIFCQPQDDIEKSKLESLGVGARVKVKGIVGKSFEKRPPHFDSLHLEYCLVEGIK